ncbi:pentapeptide repeat-containing protein [Flavobacterium enshiense]|uniref:pentapeptide repeat-containing protein n=1 Tax=Flavobacterium enshiense TaxID=1341165 RepID=UPI00345CB311
MEGQNYFMVFNSQDELDDYLNRSPELYHEEYGKYYFEQSLFTFHANFRNIKSFESIVYFQNSEFKKTVTFKNKTFKKEVHFEGCKFEDHVDFSNAEFHDVVTFPDFSSVINFRKAKFNSDVFFGKNFNDVVTFSHSEFKNNVDFSESTFEKDVYFNDCIFEKDVYFEVVDFVNKVNSWNVTYKSNVTFKWSNFRGKANFSEIKVEKGLLDLHGVNFEKNSYFYNSTIKNLDLDKSVIDKGVFFLGSKIKKSNRETFRIIKNEFNKQNNHIESLNYHQREMYSYFKELLAELIPKKNESILNYLLKFLRNLNNLVILLLNFISNFFGLSWIFGVVFTFTSTYLMYKLYVSHLTFEGEISFWQYYPQFLSPIHKFDFIENVKQTKYSYLIDFLGRIVSSFGFYQTVQAFRKYGK